VLSVNSGEFNLTLLVGIGITSPFVHIFHVPQTSVTQLIALSHVSIFVSLTA
jgi:hypothetical protein